MIEARARIVDGVAGGLVGLLVLLGLYLTSLVSYLLFHTLVELFSIIVAVAIFLIVWNARRLLENDALLFLGISFLFVAALDVLHTLSYKGMGVFAGFGANVPTQLWVASRYLQALAFLIAPAFLVRRLPEKWAMAGGVVIVALIVVSVFVWPVFPEAYVEGEGLTPFKIASEYVISGMLLLGGFLLWQRRRALDPTVWRWLAAAILFNVGAEMAFTFYLGVYDLSNLVGHFLKVLSFYGIYKAVVETGLVRPYSLLFRELKRSEVGLREERDLISAILEVAGALILVLDPQGRIVRFNRTCELTTGYTADEVTGLPFWDLFLIPEEIAPVKAVFAELAAGQFPNRHENHWVSRSGQRRLIAWSNTAIVDRAGDVAYIVATGIDITEQRRVEDENLSLAQFPLQNPNPVLRVSAEGEILYGNEGSSALLACWEVGVGELLPPEWLRFVRDVYRSGERREQDIECGERIYSVVSAPVSEGKYVNLYAMDVTTRRQIEAQLQAHNQELDAFAHTVAHDLKNPLQLLVGYTELLEESAAEGSMKNASALLPTMVRTAHKMDTIIEELLLLAGVRSAKVEPQPLDMTGLVLGAQLRLTNLIEEYEAEIQVPDEWPVALGYGPWIEAVWTNYLSNAIKYGGRPPCVELGAREENGAVRFWVRDNGDGIDAGAQSQLFVPFSQLSHVRAEGHGLGLSIVRHIVEKLGGEVGVETEASEGEGSTFYFTLPSPRSQEK